MEKVTYYDYACLEYKDGTIMKVPCKSRDDAREFISKMFDEDKHSRCWTE